MMAGSTCATSRSCRGRGVAAIYEPNELQAAAAKAFAPNARFAESAWSFCSHDPLDCLLVAHSQPPFTFRPVRRRSRRAARCPLLIEKPLYTDPAMPRAIAGSERAIPRRSGWRWYRYICAGPDPSSRQAGPSPAGSGCSRSASTASRVPRRGGPLETAFNRMTGGTGFVEKCCHFFDLSAPHLADDRCGVMARRGRR